MISQLVRRPSSTRRPTLRPTTGKVNEANKKQSNQCFEVGKKHMMRKQYEQALKHYSNAITHNPHNYKALCNMGSIFKEHKEYSEARNCYNKALLEQPKDYITLYNLGNLERIIGCDELAINQYGIVRSLKEKEGTEMGEIYYNTLINEGICFKNLRLYDQAIGCNDRAIEINSQDETPHFNKSMCLLKKIYGLTTAQPNLNLSFVRNKLCSDAQKSFENVLALNHNNFTAKVALAELVFLRNCTQQSVEQSIKKMESLKTNAPSEEIYKIDVKIKYCQNLLKKFEEQQKANYRKSQIETVELNQKADDYSKPDKQAEPQPSANLEPQTQNIGQLKKEEQPLEISQAEDRPQSEPINASSTSKQDIVSLELPMKTEEASQEQSQHKDSEIPRNVDSPSLEQQVTSKKEMPEGQLVNMEPEDSKPNEVISEDKGKYEAEIIANFKKSQQTGNEALLQTAMSLYQQHILLNNEQTPITSSMCSLQGHEIMAGMLNQAKNYSQAAKHYEVLLEMLQDQNFEKDKGSPNELEVKNIQSELGVCYVRTGMRKEAIKLYRKSYELQPDNYFLMTNMCALLIDEDQKEEANSYYQGYLASNGADQMEDKVEFVDCLLNICICQRETDGEEEAIERALSAIATYFPSTDDVRDKLNELSVVDVYLRKADLLEYKCQHSSPEQKKHSKEELLDLYLACLQFDSCPDRQAISANTGILFYASGCYANALAFFKSVVVKRSLVANSMGLTLLRLQEFEKALPCFQYATQQFPENIIYLANLEIVKWIYGMPGAQLLPDYRCGCEAMFVNRLGFGLWMLDELTLMIENMEVNSTNDKDSQNTVAGEAKKLVDRLLTKAKQTYGDNQNGTHKAGFLISLFESHMPNCQSHGDKNSLQPVISQILNASLGRYDTIQEFTSNFSKLVELLQKVDGQHEDAFLITQSAISFAMVANSHLQQLSSTLIQLLTKPESSRLAYNQAFLETEEYREANEESAIEKQGQINSPRTDLAIKVLQDTLNDIECLVENSMRPTIEQIESLYYSNTELILSALDVRYVYPHCQITQTCGQCQLNSSALFSSLFGKAMDAHESQDSTVIELGQTLHSSFRQFVHSCVESETSDTFCRQNNKIQIKLEPQVIPVHLVTHHRNLEGVLELSRSIDKSFDGGNIQNAEKGVITAILNKRVALEMWWGQSLTTLDKFSRWVVSRSSNLLHDSIGLLNANIEPISHLLGSRKLFQTPISALFKIPQ